MIRRFNYTGRKRILREDVPISLTGSKPIWGFDIDLTRITSYEFPPSARIYVEAYEQASYMRFDFGSVEKIAPVSKDARVLSEFEGSDGVRFRIKVVDASLDAKVLAEADGILPLPPRKRLKTSCRCCRYAISTSDKNCGGLILKRALRIAPRCS